MGGACTSHHEPCETGVVGELVSLDLHDSSEIVTTLLPLPRGRRRRRRRRRQWASGGCPDPGGPLRKHSAGAMRNSLRVGLLELVLVSVYNLPLNLLSRSTDDSSASS